jgi:hypothetical protein
MTFRKFKQCQKIKLCFRRGKNAGVRIYFTMWPEAQTDLRTRKNRELPDTAGHKETRSNPVLVTETSAQLGQEWTL